MDGFESVFELGEDLVDDAGLVEETGVQQEVDQRRAKANRLCNSTLSLYGTKL